MWLISLGWITYSSLNIPLGKMYKNRCVYLQSTSKCTTSFANAKIAYPYIFFITYFIYSEVLSFFKLGKSQYEEREYNTSISTAMVGA